LRIRIFLNFFLSDRKQNYISTCVIFINQDFDRLLVLFI